MIGWIALAGAVAQFAGAVVAYRTVSRRRRLIGDGLVYAGFAAQFGAVGWWLFA